MEGAAGESNEFSGTEAIVEGLNNHHLLEMSQREIQPEREGLDKVSFKVPSPHEVSEF